MDSLRFDTWNTSCLNEMNCVSEKQTFRKIIVYLVSIIYWWFKYCQENREGLILTWKNNYFSLRYCVSSVIKYCELQVQH